MLPWRSSWLSWALLRCQHGTRKSLHYFSTKKILRRSSWTRRRKSQTAHSTLAFYNPKWSQSHFLVVSWLTDWGLLSHRSHRQSCLEAKVTSVTSHNGLSPSVNWFSTRVIAFTFGLNTASAEKRRFQLSPVSPKQEVKYHICYG